MMQSFSTVDETTTKVEDVLRDICSESLLYDNSWINDIVESYRDTWASEQYN